MDNFSPFFEDSYDPLRAGSIDGTDEYPHDKAIARAMTAVYKPNKFVKGDPYCTVFVGRLNPNTSEETLKSSFREFGKVKRVRLVRDTVTGFSKCYGFVEFYEKRSALCACRDGHSMVIDDHTVLVDMEKERTLKGWIPRRLGGGIGGKRESGQLRFGGKDRPFKKPIKPVGLRANEKDSLFSNEGHRERERERYDRHRNRSDRNDRSRNRYRR